MSSTENPRVPVRRSFGRRALVVFVLLLPFAAESVWSYVEDRRQDASLKRIVSSGEPIATPSLRLSQPAETAERYYRAAAALSSTYNDTTREIIGAVAAAERDDSWSPDLIARTRTVVGQLSDALDYIDRAAPLPFEGFRPGYVYNYLSWGLSDAARGALLRGVVRASDGEADAAADSLYSAVRAYRWADMNYNLNQPYDAWVVPGLRAILSRCEPTGDALQRLDQAFAFADRDDVLSETFMRVRTALLDSHPASPIYLLAGYPARGIVIDRPWAVHELNSGLADFERAIAASKAPWPQRIDAVAAVGAFPFVAYGSYRPSRASVTQIVNPLNSRVRPLAAVRVARAAIAIERYRREHGGGLPGDIDALVPMFLPAVPVDPFSGKGLRFVALPDRYRIYSVGENRTDDGGDFAQHWLQNGSRLTPDIGIEVRTGRR